ncbi:MAG: type toxin-antitoxin system, ribonuclease toxin BrnT [Gammaproteobacteria bacterium]|nr:type toxin-antitoxin system, ribonuclease toxin BrnT [Gammaproteobacteria bacterium]
MEFEWDKNKNHFNKRKHGINFETASFVFNDPFLLSVPDNRYSYEEERWRSLGMIHETIIYVAHTVRGNEHEKEIIRIISARAATSSETKQYYANCKNAKRH